IGQRHIDQHQTRGFVEHAAREGGLEPAAEVAHPLAREAGNGAADLPRGQPDPEAIDDRAALGLKVRSAPLAHRPRLTATPVEWSSSVNVKVMKPNTASRIPVTPRWFTVDPGKSRQPLRT